jgi:hypothetical protein
MEEARYGGLIDKYWILQVIVIPLLVVASIIGIIFFILSFGFSTENFRLSCESYGGRFYELQNTSCKIGHADCLFNCALNDKVYNLDELGHQWSYSKYFCIEDCSYENSKNNELRCVC